jgi:ribonuclease D
MSTSLHVGDLPEHVSFGDTVAIDTETMGLNPHRDRLCLVQLSAGDDTCHIVQFRANQGVPVDYSAPNLKRLLADPAVLKLFHFARFDIATLHRYLGVTAAPVYCTKIASKLARTYTDRHGLKDLCREFLEIDLSKQQQSSDWGASELSAAQLDYAAQDVLHLHRLKTIFDQMLEREGRREIAEACFGFLSTRVALDLKGWPEIDIFAH